MEEEGKHLDILSAMNEQEPQPEVADIDTEIKIPEAVLEARLNPPYIARTLEAIDNVNEYGHNRGSMGLDFGIQSLNTAFNGLNPGLTLVAGGANTGKSMVLLEIMRRVITNNQFQTEDHPKKAYCIYFSLDDSNNELMPRMVAADQRILINHALFPKTLQDKPVIMDKRAKGFENLKSNAGYFSMFDAEYGQSIQRIEELIAQTHSELEMVAPGEYQIVIFIDNFHDITYDNESGFMEDNQKFDYISGRLNELAIQYDSPVICSAEFRKINVMKRPQEDDVKSTGKIVYEAKAIILVYNEVGVKGDSSNIYWEMGSRDSDVEPRKMPVLEMHVSKNKFGSYKGRNFLKFLPEMASFIEPGDDEEQIFRQMIKG